MDNGRGATDSTEGAYSLAIEIASESGEEFSNWLADDKPGNATTHCEQCGSVFLVKDMKKHMKMHEGILYKLIFMYFICIFYV